MSKMASTRSKLWKILCTRCRPKVQMLATFPASPKTPTIKMETPSVANSKESEEPWRAGEAPSSSSCGFLCELSSSEVMTSAFQRPFFVEERKRKKNFPLKYSRLLSNVTASLSSRVFGASFSSLFIRQRSFPIDLSALPIDLFSSSSPFLAFFFVASPSSATFFSFSDSDFYVIRIFYWRQ